MRRNRLILLGLWILSLVGISLSGGEITYGLFFLLTLIPAVSLIYILLVRNLFRIYQNVEGNSLVAGQPAVFTFILQNESLILFSGIRVLFYSSFSVISGLSDKTEYELLPKEGIRKETDIVCQYRGEYEIGIKTIEITDFFRLFTVSCRNPEPKTVRVKPNIIRLTTMTSLELPLAALMESGVNPTEPDLLMRNYLPGDDPRLINWKASSARGELMVRQLIGEQSEGIGILLDSGRYSQQAEVYLPLENRMLETVIALNLYLSQKGIPVETWFCQNEPERLTVTRDSGFEPFYNRMCEFRFSDEQPAQKLFESARKSPDLYLKKLVVLILHEWNGAAYSVAERLNRSGISVIAYVIGGSSAAGGHTLPRTAVIQLPSDGDLSEVL